MGQSTDGQICYGILLEEEAELPWEEDPFEGDMEAWWLHVNGYKPPFELYGEDGEYLPHLETTKDQYGRKVLADPSLSERYYAAERAFEESHPLPVEAVNCCSGDYPRWILAVPSTVKRAHRGDPEELGPAAMSVDEEEERRLIEFCQAHEISFLPDDGPKWWLSSYWG